MCVNTVLRRAMNVDDDVKVDHILVQVDIFIPGSSPELLRAVGTSIVDEE